MSQDPFALLLEEDSDDQYEEEKNIPCLQINNNELDLTIEDWLFADDKYTDKIRVLLKYLKHDKDLTSNKYKTFDLTIDLTEKELEIQENNPLYGLKYILDLSKQYMTSLSIYITAYRDLRQLPFNNPPDPLDNDVLVNIFEIIQESISKYKLSNLSIQWIPVHTSNYNQFTNGIIDILNIKPNQITQTQKQIPISILFTSEWLEYLSNSNQKALINAIENCQICKELTLGFDKSNIRSPFDENALKSMVLIFNAIENNSCIQSLNIVENNFSVSNNINENDCNIVNALAKCLQYKTISKTLKDNNFSLDLQFDQHNDFLPSKENLHLLLNALYANENICLNEFALCNTDDETNWDSKTIELICDLLKSDSHRIVNLILEGHFHRYKVVGFDKLVNCLVNSGENKEDEENENIFELNKINIGYILDINNGDSYDGDSDIYNEYVIKLIEQCNIWLESITIKYEKFNGNITQVIQAFFNRLKVVYVSLKSIENELLKIFEGEDIVNLIVDFCKMERFEIFIMDLSDRHDFYSGGGGEPKRPELSTERAEFRHCLYEFLGKIEYQMTAYKFVKEICINSVAIWKGVVKKANTCVSV
eukprot:303880_1